MLNLFHYKPLTINDSVSADVFNDFISLLDNNDIYFLKKDIQDLASKKYLLNQTINNNNCDFIKAVTAIYKKRLTETDSIVRVILNKKFDFSQNDTITYFFNQKKRYSSEIKQNVKRWNNWLKYQALQNLVVTNDSLLKIINTPQFDLLEAEIRNKLLVRETRIINQILKHPKGIENYVASMYMKAFAARFDPHSTYFTNEEKYEFESSLSLSSLDYGLVLSEAKNGLLQIERLIPGSAAWNSNKLHKEDNILKVKWQGVNYIDLVLSTVQEFSELINSNNTGKINLIIKKKSGLIDTVLLSKTIIQDEEALIKSYVLNGEKKVGYINLPDFYSDWSNSTASGCANDVAKEILKLKSDKIEGLIIDLRFNGGGSMQEAINLIGIFINEGPVLINHDRGAEPNIIKDPSRGVIYDGPLTILVNNFSASASELVALTLQTLNRALIVGNQTFGKSTSQIILPIIPNPNQNSVLSAVANQNKSYYGFTKVTNGKFYSVNGVSHQLYGVKPDVQFPDIYAYLELSEKNEKYALANDTAKKSVNYIAYKKLPIKEIQANSQTRLNNSPVNKFIVHYADSVKSIFKKDLKISLNINSFLKQSKNISSTNLDLIMNNITNVYKVENNSFDDLIINADTEKISINTSAKETILNDFYLAETYNITLDLIKLINTK